MHVRRYGVTAILLAGLLQAWAQRFYIHLDSLQYLDIASAYARGDFDTAINPSWSPLLSWLYVPFVLILPRNLEWSVFHLLNVLILAATLHAFLRLVGVVFEREQRELQPATMTLLLAIFAWTQLWLIPMHFLSGDRLGLAFFLYALAEMFRPRDVGNAIKAGALFAAAYLAKSIYLPVAFATFAFFMLFMRPRHHVVVAAIAFVVIAAPWVAMLSIHQHYLTYSDAGHVNYLWNVNDIPGVHHRSPALLHPLQVINEDPLLLGVEAPFKATYNVQYDPAYWYAGLKTPVDVARLVRNLFANILPLLRMLLPLLVLTAIAATVAQRREKTRSALLLLLITVAGTAFYCMLHIEPRYIAPFALLAGIAAATSLRCADHAPRDILLLGVGFIACCYYMLYSIALDGLALAGHDRRWAPWRDNPAAVRALARAGIGEGDQLAGIGDDFFMHNARVVGARFVAVTPADSSATFWRASVEKQEQAIERLRERGVKAVITSHADPRWQPLAGPFYIRRLR